MDVVEIYVDALRSVVTDDISQVFTQKINDLRNDPNFDIEAISQLPPVSMEMFEGHPDPLGAFREAVIHADTVAYLITILEALICSFIK